jgi:HEAT repeat protein
VPNRKVMEAATERRRRGHHLAVREYRRHKAEVPKLIQQLGGPTQAVHDRAFRLLAGMSDAVTDELLAALADPELDPIVGDEVISLLGTAGDPRAIEPVWAFFQMHRNNPERASTGAICLAGLGDDRVLPYLRESLRTGESDSVSNAAAAMIMLGQLEDIPLLRVVHRQFKADTEIREGIANAILAILGEADETTLEQELDDIQGSLADRDLWDDIWALLERSFGSGRYKRSARRRPRSS